MCSKSLAKQSIGRRCRRKDRLTLGGRKSFAGSPNTLACPNQRAASIAPGSRRRRLRQLKSGQLTKNNYFCGIARVALWSPIGSYNPYFVYNRTEKTHKFRLLSTRKSTGKDVKVYQPTTWPRRNREQNRRPGTSQIAKGNHGTRVSELERKPTQMLRLLAVNVTLPDWRNAFTWQAIAQRRVAIVVRVKPHLQRQ